jgi:hypothetical protein
MNLFHKTRLIQKEMWNTAQILFWGIIFLLFFSTLFDVLLIKTEWLSIVLLKFLLVLLFYTVYVLAKSINKTPNFLLNMVLLGYSLVSFFVISEVDFIGQIVYFTLLITVYLAFNSLVLWHFVYSLAHFAVLVASCLALIYFEKIEDSNRFLQNGGYLFFTVVFISSFFPKMRMLSVLEKYKWILKKMK